MASVLSAEERTATEGVDRLNFRRNSHPTASRSTRWLSLEDCKHVDVRFRLKSSDDIKAVLVAALDEIVAKRPGAVADVSDELEVTCGEDFS
jgi:hypothetical protein